MRRRRLLGTFLGVGVAGIAGCLGDDGDKSGDEGDHSDHPAGTPTDTGPDRRDSSPFVDEVADVPTDVICGVCNMTPADYPDSNAQTVHENEHKQFFCSPGCAITYHVLPDEFGIESDIHRTWIREYPNRELTALEDLWLVMNTLPERGMDPMWNPVPFAKRSHATEYVADFDDLTESDIAAEADLDRETVLEYRDWYVTRES